MKMPTMVPVKSSNLQAVGYSNHGLFVRFAGGGLYSYPGAPKSIYDEIVQAESPGGAFREKVHSKYPHLKHDA